jgi:hypothetical protein
VVALLSKMARRVVPVRVDFVGFEIEDEFVVGFGMDAAGRYRGLRDIAIYDAAREVITCPTSVRPAYPTPVFTRFSTVCLARVERLGAGFPASRPILHARRNFALVVTT